MRFSSAQKTRLARASAQWPPVDIGGHRGAPQADVIELARTAAVRADRRLRTDEKHVRAQSAILDKNNPKPLLPLSITVFLVRMVFIRTKNTVGARERASPLLACDSI
jgi:hypothetical protein